MAKTRTGVSLASVGKALSKALALLTRRSYSEAELRRKLEGFDPDEVEAVVERLRKWGYLNDQAYAQAFVARRLRRYGPRRLRYELLRRGVSEQLVDELMNEWDEVEAAFRVLVSRAPRYRERRERAVRFLVGRGFSLDAALSAYERLQAEEQEG